MSAAESQAHPPVVLQVLPSLVTGGVERGAIEITQAIAEAEAVALVTSAGGPLVPSVHRAGGRHIQLPLLSRDPVNIWRNAARLEALIRAEKVSIVHARSRAPAWSAWLACKRTGAHFVTTYHGVYNEELPFKRVYNGIMAKGEIVIAASHYVANVVQRQHKLAADRIRVIPRGIDPTVFDPDSIPPDRIARMAQTMRAPDGMLTVVMLGRLTSWKGQAVVLQAIARLPRRDVCCVLVGSDQGRTKYAKELETLSESLGIGDRVRIIGHVDDVPAALMLSDAVVHASTEAEAFGRVVIEAQAMGRPVIATDLGGPSETVEHGVTGWLTAPGDPASLAESLFEVLSLDTEARMALGQRARASVLRSYTVRAMQDATLNVYEAVLAHARDRVTA
ncbi:MAG: glycosyltransferase [Acetobacteraceae bacterium]|nr:glycosyltransferase [Acetobacteraceae bacterium]